MAIFLSPGVFPREIDLSILPAATGALTPAFIGTANKGPVQEPIFCSNAQQFIDNFGNPFPESFLGYAALAYFEEGNRAYVLRVGVECEEGQAASLADVCIDLSGARGHGWGRIPVFTGIDFGKICTRVIDATNPLSFHPALVPNGPVDYNDIFISPSEGPCNATLIFSSPTSYTGAIDDAFTVLILSDPSPSLGGTLGGAAYEVIRNSDGLVVRTGVLVESVPGASDPVNIGEGIVFQVVVIGSVPIGTQDTLSFRAQPDNRKFSFNVDRALSVVEYTMPTASYTTTVAFVAAFNALLGGGEKYKAVAKDDDTVCFTTDVAGWSIQLTSTEAFALQVGQSLYVYDIPRSFLQSTDSGPYNISSENNRVSMQIVGRIQTVNMEFSLPVGTQTPGSMANAINNGGILNGVRYFRSYAMLVPGGFEEVFIETDASTPENEFSQLQLMADLSHYKTLRFAEELNILYPYTRSYRTFSDPRVMLPVTGAITPSDPLSCEIDPLSSACLADSAYFGNIVGWLVAISPGTWVDGVRVTIEPFIQNTSTGEVVPGMFRIIIEDSNFQKLDVVDNVSFDTSNDRYIANIINPGSKYGGTNGNSFINWVPRPSFLKNDPVNDPTNYENRVPGPIYRKIYVGQANGIPTDPAYSTELDRAVIGNPGAETGIFAFQNPEVFDITLLICPGFSSGAVIGNMLQMCESRGDCMSLIDPPFGLRAQQVVDWSNGILFSDLARAINSSYGALYHPWLKIFDQFSGNDVFIPPSGHVSAVYARTARDTEQWFAPAGLTRGRLITPIDTEVDLTQGERDLMYGYGNAVNPIVNFPQDGIVVWGQRTLQRKQSALDRVNVRMLLIFIKKNATQFLRQFIFEPNDNITRAQVVSISNPFLADIQARRGLTGFAVVCDERNNTPERIDRNELHVAYFLKPTRAVEFIQLNLVILRTEASFTAEEVLAAGGVTLVTTTP